MTFLLDEAQLSRLSFLYNIIKARITSMCVHYAVLSLNKNLLFRWISCRPVLNLKAADFFLNFWS